jgi:hypothetical protein
LHHVAVVPLAVEASTFQAACGGAGAQYGSDALHLTKSSTGGDVSAWSPYAPVVGGTQYTGRISGHFWSSIQGMALQIEWWSDTAEIASSTGARVTGAYGTDEVAYETATAPTGATRARLRPYDAGVGTWDVFLDGAMLVAGSSTPNSYDVPPQIVFTGTNRPTSSGALLPFTLTDDGGIQSFAISVDGRLGWSGGASQSPATCLCPTSATPNASVANLPDGAYTVRVTATDGGGTSSEQTFPIVVDRSGPTITATDLGHQRATSDADELTFQFDDDTSGLARIEFSAEGDPSWNQAVTYDAGDTPAFSCTVPAHCDLSTSRAVTIGDLPDGIRKVLVKATDADGNVTDESWRVNVDRVAPDIDITPPARDVVGPFDTVAFAFDDHGGSGLQTVDLSSDQGGWDGARTFDWTCAFDELCDSTSSPDASIGNLTSGEHTITATAEDADGNISSEDVTVDVDADAPEIHVPDGFHEPVYYDSTGSFVAGVDDPEGGSGLTNFNVTSDQAGWDGNVSDGSTALGCGGECPMHHTESIAIGNLTPGCHAITLSAADRANNTATKTFLLSVNASDGDYVEGGDHCTIDAPGFDIDVDPQHNPDFSAQNETDFQAAAARWEHVITGDVPAQRDTNGRIVDDLEVAFYVDHSGSMGSTIALGQPDGSQRRPGSPLSYYGTVTVNATI